MAWPNGLAWSSLCIRHSMHSEDQELNSFQLADSLAKTKFSMFSKVEEISLRIQ